MLRRYRLCLPILADRVQVGNCLNVEAPGYEPKAQQQLKQRDSNGRQTGYVRMLPDTAEHHGQVAHHTYACANESNSRNDARYRSRLIQKEAKQEVVYGWHEAWSKKEDAVVQSGEGMTCDQRNCASTSSVQSDDRQKKGCIAEDSIRAAARPRVTVSFCFLGNGKSTTAEPMPARTTMISSRLPITAGVSGPLPPVGIETKAIRYKMPAEFCGQMSPVCYSSQHVGNAFRLHFDDQEVCMTENDAGLPVDASEVRELDENLAHWLVELFTCTTAKQATRITRHGQVVSTATTRSPWVVAPRTLMVRESAGTLVIEGEDIEPSDGDDGLFWQSFVASGGVTCAVIPGQRVTLYCGDECFEFEFFQPAT